MDSYRQLVLNNEIKIHNEELLYAMVQESGLGFPEVSGLCKYWGVHLRIFQHDEPVAFYRRRYNVQFKRLEENARAFLAVTQSETFQRLHNNLEKTRYDTQVAKQYHEAGPGLLEQFRIAGTLCRELLTAPESTDSDQADKTE